MTSYSISLHLAALNYNYYCSDSGLKQKQFEELEQHCIPQG